MPGSKAKSAFIAGFICLLLAGITLAIYWPLTRAEFNNYDDPLYVLENSHVQGGLTAENVAWAFASGYAANWHPVTWISHMLDCQFFGLDAGKHHRTNLLLHVINTLLLFGWLRSMTGAVWRSALVAALFAWHPVHVESVAWVAERKDVLSTLFWILTLWTYLAYVREVRDGRRGGRPGVTGGGKVFANRLRAWGFYALALLLFALGLMAKPMLVTLPFVLLLLDFWPFRRFGPGGLRGGGRLVLEKLPFFALSAAASVTTYLVQGAGGAFGERHFALDVRIINMFMAYVRYLGKLVWPADLAVFYPYPQHWPGWQVMGAGLILLAITSAAPLRATRQPFLIVGWLWFIGTLVPVIGLVQVGEQSMADRYTYVPAIGMFIALAWAIPDFSDSVPAWKWFMASGAALALGGCLLVTRTQIRYWHDSTALHEHSLAVNADDKIRKLVHDYLAKLRREPNNDQAHLELGVILAERGRWIEATNHYARAVSINPANAAAHYDYGVALAKLGNLDEAMAQQIADLRLRPDHAEGRAALGDLLARRGQFAEAKRQLTEAVRLQPANVEAQVRLAQVLSQSDEIPPAISHYQEALRQTPDEIEALNNLAWILATTPDARIRNGREAVRLAEHACALTQNREPFLLGTLAASYAEAGRFPDAVATAGRAINLAQAGRQNAVAARNQELLALYQAHRPYHEERPSADGKAGK